jgi:DNA-binding transcriptional MerR regulator
MTVGELSRRTGVPVKSLREYADWGLIYTAGRSAANYRLFDAEALWCVALIRELRGLGLTLAEIRELAGRHLQRTGEPIGPHLARLLRAARGRLDARIAELQAIRRHIDAFEADHRAGLAGLPGTQIWPDDPRDCAATG